MSLNNKTPDLWNKMFAEGRDYQVINQIFLDELVKNQNIQGDILDTGCGTGDLVVKLSQRGMNVTGLDFSSVAIEKAKERLKKENVPANLILGSVADVKGQFNAIFCKLVYAFVEDKEEFLGAIKDHLKDNGKFILITPILNELNKNIETKPAICVIPQDIEKLSKFFSMVTKYHINYEEEGRIVETYVCQK